MSNKPPVKVIIDGTEYVLPKMKFKTLKKAFAIVMAVQDEEDPMKLADAAIEVISLAAIKKHPDMTPEWIEENLNADESSGLTNTMLDLMIDAGVMTAGDKTQLMGEAPGAQQAPHSTETSTPSLPNSLPQDAAAEIGTQ